MSDVARFSEIIGYAPDLNKKRREIVSKMAHYEIDNDRLAVENAELREFVKSVEFTMAKTKKHNELSNHDNEMLRQQIERANKILNKHK